MTDFLKIAKSIVVRFAHICAYGVETVKVKSNAFHPILQNIVCSPICIYNVCYIALAASVT